MRPPSISSLTAHDGGLLRSLFGLYIILYVRVCIGVYVYVYVCMHVLCICIYVCICAYVWIYIYKKSLSSLPYFVFIMYHDYIVYLMNCFVYYLCKHILYYVLYYFERRNKSKQTNKQNQFNSFSCEFRCRLQSWDAKMNWKISLTQFKTTTFCLTSQKQILQ